LRAVVQRVCSAHVSVEGETLGSMEQGLLALVGVAPDDGPDQVRFLAQKMVHLRLFPDEAGVMNRSLLEAGGSLGIVSQFTLFADVSRGTRAGCDGDHRKIRCFYAGGSYQRRTGNPAN